MSKPRFEDLTETTGIPLSPEAAQMMYTRYRAGADLAAGKRVLELGCGSGQGFSIISARAGSLVGGDYSLRLLRDGQRHHRGRYPLVQLSADALPFREDAFDLVLFFEASYYVPDMAAGFSEIYRVLARGGTVLFVNSNPERGDFVRSPHSVEYHTADGFREALELRGYAVTTEGAFASAPQGGNQSLKERGLSLARRVLSALGLVPKTLRGRARLKRLVYRRLLAVPPDLPEKFAPVATRAPIARGPVLDFKVLYVTATKSR